jgi:hypothetical protein
MSATSEIPLARGLAYAMVHNDDLCAIVTGGGFSALPAPDLAFMAARKNCPAGRVAFVIAHVDITFHGYLVTTG